MLLLLQLPLGSDVVNYFRSYYSIPSPLERMRVSRLWEPRGFPGCHPTSQLGCSVLCLAILYSYYPTLGDAAYPTYTTLPLGYCTQSPQRPWERFGPHRFHLP
ncbi:Hypothetical protein NTJ_01003 [Nesidiocoris tenuis]|uniref:Uncharacterized protein n=1 Tax=Nesidiocoris tenuis TaxID=355587 RepID=A0ABN7A7E3_9HEMI|nr:Hypothetical protein NTJ_01003 [Nesidiocoris tenuis]